MASRPMLLSLLGTLALATPASAEDSPDPTERPSTTLQQSQLSRVSPGGMQERT